MNKQNKKINYTAYFIVMLFVASCSMPKTQRIKVSITMQDGDKVVTTSAVQQFSCYKTIDVQGMPSIGGCDIKGEAIPIKFSNNKYVFMLFTGSNIQGTNASFYTNAIHNKIPQNDNESWDVYPENAPMFVTFDNLNDPKTVKAVYFRERQVVGYYEDYKPGPLSNVEKRPVMITEPPNASKVLGQNIDIVSIHVEKTKEHVTWGRIEKVLPWLKGMDTGDFLFESLGDSGARNKTKQLQLINFIWK